MYIVSIRNGTITTQIHGTKQKLKNGNIVRGINSIDSFSFSLLPNNKGWRLLNEFTTFVKVYNTNKKRYEFFGRVLQVDNEMDSNGRLLKNVVSESYLGFLCDSVQKYVAVQNWTVNGLLQHLLDVHNSQVEDYKKIILGNVTVTDPNDNLYIGIQRENTWEAIKNKLIDKLGGEVQFRVVDDLIYLDYLEEIGQSHTEPIEISKNMKSIEKEKDATSYITRLIPLGAKIEDADGKETEERIDITSVNDGKDYIEDETAKSVYGIHSAYVYFDDVTVPSILKTKGQAYLAENNKIKIKYTVSALDLSLLGLQYADFRVHDYYPIKNNLLGIDDVARIIKQNIDIVNEIQSTFELGDSLKTFSDLQREQEKNYQELQGTITEVKNELKDYVNNTENRVNQTIITQTTTMKNDFEKIMFEALTNYTETNDFETYKEIVSAQFTMLSNELELKFTQTQQELVNINGDLQEKINTITKYFTFDINGLTIGQIDNPNKVVIDNNKISILVNEQVVQEFDSYGQALIPILRITKALDLLGFYLGKDDTGNVNCEYTGG